MSRLLLPDSASTTADNHDSMVHDSASEPVRSPVERLGDRIRMVRSRPRVGGAFRTPPVGVLLSLGASRMDYLLSLEILDPSRVRLYNAAKR
jgi:hypothetical protein